MLLGKIETTNKLLQGVGLDIDRASKLVKGLLSWLKDFRGGGFIPCLRQCISDATKMGLPYYSGFSKSRPNRNIPQLDMSRSTYKNFEITYFNPILDALITEFGTRFDHLHKIENLFNFLWGEKLENFSSYL